MARTRHWFGTARYPGRETFHLGTVQAESPEHARTLLLALWASLSPHPAPDITEVHPGMLVIAPDA